MKYGIFIYIIFFFSTILYGQNKPDFLPEDINTENIKYCQPGVKNKSRSRGLDIQLGIHGKGQYLQEENVPDNYRTDFDQFRSWQFKMKVPVILREDFKLLVGYKHFDERFAFSQIDPTYQSVLESINNNKLKNNAFSLLGSKSLDHDNYIFFNIGYSLNGTYEEWVNFGKQYTSYRALVGYLFKKNEDFEWGFAGAISKSFRRTIGFPLFIYNRNFTPKWGIEAALPGYIYGRYNFNESTIGLLGVEFNSKSYRIDNQDFDFAFNHSEVVMSAKLEQRFAPWIWGSLRVGYRYNFSSDFERKGSEGEDFSLDPTNMPFINFSIFISPEDKMPFDVKK